MKGFERLKDMLDKWLEKNKDDEAFKHTINYLLERKDLEYRFLNEEKNLEDLHEFIQEKGRQHLLNGWCYITNEVVFSWAVMYFSLPNSFLKIKEKSIKKNNTKRANKSNEKVISIEKAREKIEEKTNSQLSLFGGNA